MVTLVFVGIIVFFFLLDLLVIRRLERNNSLKGARDEHNGTPPTRDLVMPRSYFFHPGHVWARIEKTGEVTVGVDDLVQAVMGAVGRVEPPTLGQRVRAGDSAFTLGQRGKSLLLPAPLSGLVSSVNRKVVERPGLINADPYEAGWVFRIEPDQGPVQELALLFIGRQAAEWMSTEVDRLRELAETAAVGGGKPALLKHAEAAVWHSFQERFLNRAAALEA